MGAYTEPVPVHCRDEKTSKRIYVMGLQHKTAGHHSKVDNLPPDTSKII